jgi:hypothetical protein
MREVPLFDILLSVSVLALFVLQSGRLFFAF